MLRPVRRLALQLADKNEWVKVFDPRGGSVFVAGGDPPEVGADVRVDLIVGPGGPRVILKGTVVFRRHESEGRGAAGCGVGLLVDEREKVNFLNGYVRGGLINRRERRRLPLRLPVTYRAEEGIRDSFCRDINEEGIFILAERPLPEEEKISFTVRFPDHEKPIAFEGIISHTVIPEDEDVPGMGIRFTGGDLQPAEIVKIIDELERRFLAGTLSEEAIT
jgi:hypothetical protein